MDQRVVLITGSNRGIGLAAASVLADSGFVVFGTHRATSNTESLDRAIEVSGGNLRKIILDVTDTESIATATNEVIADQGKIDIVINNACDVVVGTVENCTLTQQQRSMDVNYFGPVRVLQNVLPHMRGRRSGHIVNISSISGIDPYPPIETYTATKFALEGLSESLATNLAPWNIKVSIVEPGGVKTRAPERAEQGARDIGCYATYSMAAQRKMVESYDQGALEPKRVAEAVLACLSADQPNLRYQVGDFAERIAKERFLDPTGNGPVEAKRGMLDEQGLYDLIDR